MAATDGPTAASSTKPLKKVKASKKVKPSKKTVSADASSFDEADGSDEHKRPSVRRKRRKGPFIALAIVLVILIAACAAFSWVRWWRVDDAADLQGVWRIDNSDKTITITDSTMILNRDTTYTYQMDTFSKTITFNLQDLQGQGRYRFTEDRQAVAILDGGDCSWFATLVADTGWQLSRWWADLTHGERPLLAEGEGLTKLFRVGAVPIEQTEGGASGGGTMIITLTNPSEQQVGNGQPEGGEAQPAEGQAGEGTPDGAQPENVDGQGDGQSEGQPEEGQPDAGGEPQPEGEPEPQPEPQPEGGDGQSDGQSDDGQNG